MTRQKTEFSQKLRTEMTPPEQKLWLALRHDQLGLRCRRQHAIGPYIADFYFPSIKLAVELDGETHVSDEQKSYDEARTKYFESNGIRTLRFWNNEVLTNIEGVVETLSLSLNPSPSQVRERETDWRSDFPSMSSMMNGKPLVYLDTGASAQKPQVVIDAMAKAMSEQYANIHRGLYKFSAQKTQEFEAVRHKVADFLGVENENTIIFARNTTEAINLVAQAYGRKFLKAGDEIILSEMEHHANLVPWSMLRDQIGVVIKYIPVLEDGSLDMDAYKNLLSDKTKLVSVTHISNALGTINDVVVITKIAREHNPDIKIMFDGSQAVVHAKVNLSAFDPDFYVFTGHKLYGPTGVGVLYGRYELLEAMDPYQGGGDMIETVALDEVTYKSAPAKFEAGTPAIAEVIALGAAIDYVSSIGMENIAVHEQELLRHATEELQKFDGLHIFGTAAPKAAIISFTMNEAHPSDIAMVLDQMGIAVRTGHHCCMPLMAKFKVDATVRVSFGLYNTKEDIERLVEALQKVKSLFA